MGEQISSASYTPRQRTVYRQQLEEELEAFDRHLQEAEFTDHGTIGLELELNLVDQDMQPHPNNEAVLDGLSDEYQSEIGQFNLELNHPPLPIGGAGLADLEKGLQQRYDTVANAAAAAGSQVAMIGTLPTLTTQFLEGPSWMTPEKRYAGLQNSVMESRGELVNVTLWREENYSHDFDSIAPEAACTSVQLHLQVNPGKFARAWNASQAIAGAQVALSANSPLFLGHRVWHESRIPVFKQSVDTRTKELINQGVRPRVWFGEGWITSVFDLFEENVSFFSPLLPEGRVEAGKPEMLGNIPGLHYLNLQNGTIWRWNRPIYDPNGPLSHIRVENRILPAGPTIKDIVADAAFYYGCVQTLAEQTRPVWSRLSFADARENFRQGARHGLTANVSWPTLGTIPVTELLANHLLPIADEGLRSLDVAPEYREEYLGIIEGRVRTRQNGAMWQLNALNKLAPGAGVETPERKLALQELMRHYLKNQASGAPVHTWPLDFG